MILKALQEGSSVRFMDKGDCTLRVVPGKLISFTPERAYVEYCGNVSVYDGNGHEVYDE